MSRFTDDYPFFGAPRKGPPATLNILLAELRVSFATADEQRVVIAEWLQSNEPLPRVMSEIEQRYPALAAN